MFKCGICGNESSDGRVCPNDLCAMDFIEKPNPNCTCKYEKGLLFHINPKCPCQEHKALPIYKKAKAPETTDGRR